MPAFTTRTLRDEEIRPHSHLEDFIFTRQRLQVLTQMLKITYGSWSVTVYEQRWDGECWMFPLIIRNKRSLKCHLYICHVLFLISNPGFDPKESPPIHQSEGFKVNVFYKTTMGSKDGLFELRVDCSGFLKDRQSHGGTVESSSACSVHHLIYLIFFFFFTPIAQKNKETCLFFFAYHYVFS